MEVEGIDVAITYSQEMDCDGPGGSPGERNWLRVSTADGGGGPYLVISTERWAIGDLDDLEGFVAELRRVLQMAETGAVQ